MSGSNTGASLYTILTAHSFECASKRFFRKRPELRERFTAVLAMLERDPFAPSHRTHALRGSLDGYWGVRLTYADRDHDAIRIIEREVELFDIGSHDEVY